MTAPHQDFTLSGRMLQARFFIAGDRYAHAISLKTDRGYRIVLESAEGTPEDAWPPSPPLQSLMGQWDSAGEQLSPGRNVAMLLGMAGQSHWSLAAELVTSPDGEWLIFDFACRASAAPAFLGSRYRLGPDARWNAETDLLSLSTRDTRLRVDAATVLVRPAPSPGEIEVVPRLAPLSLPAARSDIAFPLTVRWKYSIEASKPQTR